MNQQDAVKIIENSGKHLLEMINEILDLSRIEAGRMELQEADFDLTALIKDLSVMFQLRCEQKNLNWRVEWLTATGKPESRKTRKPDTTHHSPLTPHQLVHGDEGKLRQVLINLLSNAVKFTEEGEVVLRICEDAHQLIDESDFHSSLITHHASRFTFEVIDTGIGISPEDQESIFEPFQRAQKAATQEGTGLGLAIAKKQVELMGGKLAVESPLLNPPLFPPLSKGGKGGFGGEVRGGKGSRFFFTIPLSPAREISPLAPLARRQVVKLATGYNVLALVADDVAENRDVLAKILSDIGVQVIIAEDGVQAVQQVREHRPDVVFMDIRMPKMDGLEATGQILSEFGRDLSACGHAQAGAPKMVAISASALSHERQRYLDAGFDAFIAKPFLAEQIYDCLARLLHIEYEYEDADMSQMDISKIILPAALLKRLKQAAEFGRMTELREALDEVRQVGPIGHLLAERFLSLSRNFDMDAILEILEKIDDRVVA